MFICLHYLWVFFSYHNGALNSLLCHYSCTRCCISSFCFLNYCILGNNIESACLVGYFSVCWFNFLIVCMPYISFRYSYSYGIYVIFSVNYILYMNYPIMNTSAQHIRISTIWSHCSVMGVLLCVLLLIILIVGKKTDSVDSLLFICNCLAYSNISAVIYCLFLGGIFLSSVSCWLRFWCIFFTVYALVLYWDIIFQYVSTLSGLYTTVSCNIINPVFHL